jgi:hypothetical protein
MGILTEKHKKMQQCIKVLLFLILNEAQHVSGDTPPIISSLKLHRQPLVLYNTVKSCHTCSCWTLSGSVYADPALKLSANLHDIYHCCVYSEKLLMMDVGTVRNM